MASDEWMEFLPQVLPVLDEEGGGVRYLGDLYNIRSMSRVGSIFGEDREHAKRKLEDLVYLPKRQLDYQLTHIKNTESKLNSLSLGLGMAAVVLGMKLQVGSASVSSSVESSLTKEQFQLHYKEDVCTVRLLRSAYTKPDEEAPDDCHATHVVTEVTLGADVLVTMDIEDRRATKIKSSTSSGLGFIIAGPVSSIVEASMSTAFGGETGTSTKISFEHNLPHLQEPKTIQEAFSLATKAIPDSIQATKEFPDLPLAKGSCLSFLLLPLSHFIETSQPDEGPFYKVISAPLLEALNGMLVKLTDFVYNNDEERSEDEPADCFLKKKLIYQDSRLKPMLYDLQSPISILVAEKDRVLEQEALCLLEKAKCWQVKYRNEISADISELETILKDYDARFSSVEEKLSEFFERAQALLETAHADDVDEQTKADFLFSSPSVEAWKLKASAFPFSLLMRTSNKQPAPAGSLLALYNMSKELDDGAVAVSLDDVQPPDQFELELRLGDSLGEIYKGAHILSALNIISVVLRHGTVVRSRFFQALSFQAEDAQSFFDVKQLPSTIAQLHEARYQEIEIYESFIQLRAEISKEENSSHWIFVMPVDGLCSLNEGVRALLLLKDELELGAAPRKWVVTTFNLSGFHEVPLLFLFKGGSLLAVCLDQLDILVLQSLLSGAQRELSDSELSVLSPSPTMLLNAFYPERVRFSIDVHQHLSSSFSEDQLRNSGSLNDSYFLDSDSSPDALQILTAFTGKNDNVIDMITALARMTLACMDPSHSAYRIRKLQHFLVKNHWVSILEEFYSVASRAETWVRSLLHDLLSFTFSLTEILKCLGVAVRTLETCIKVLTVRLPPSDPKEPRADPSEPLPPYDPAPEIRAALQHRDFPSSSGATKVKAEIEALMKEDFRSCIGAQEQVLFQLVHCLIPLVLDQQEDVVPTHFKDLLAVTTAFAKSFDRDELQESKRRVQQQRELLPNLQTELLRVTRGILLKVVDQDFSDLMERGDFLSILELLRATQYTEWMKGVHSTLRRMKSLQDWTSLKELLTAKSPQEEHQVNKIFLWQNPKFLFVLRKNMTNPNFVKLLVECETDASGLIPAYIPPDVSRLMRQEMNQNIPSTIPCWKPNWSDLQTAMFMFQSITVRQIIPEDFQSSFALNLTRSPELSAKLRKIGADFYWNPEKQEFRQNWSLADFRNAVELILNWEIQN